MLHKGGSRSSLALLGATLTDGVCSLHLLIEINTEPLFAVVVSGAKTS